ncbi:hypothetical protein G5A69_00415 [Ralstonia mannitolilytica]|nr:hypothetical protein G5A69_00415 [Ralstonia mannitolilytica]
MHACAVLGDRTTTGGTIITAGAGSFMTIDGKAAALWGDIATCPGCKSTGKITGETFPIQTVNGVPVARHNDLVLCGCPKKPRIVATAIHHGVADHASGTGTVGELQPPHNEREMFDRHFQLVDEVSQQPLAGRRYRLTWPGGSAEGVTNASGHTQRVQGLDPHTVHLEVLPEGD